MIQVFPIEFIREIIRQTLLREKLKSGNDNYIGGDNEINIFSFYEQLSTHDEVNRYVENYRALTKQQNKSDLIANGVLTCPSAPSITNLYSATIIPMDWSLFVRTTLKDRDQVVYSFNNLIEVLNGRAHDLALLTRRYENGKIYYQPFMLPRVGNDDGSGQPKIESGMFLGTYYGSGQPDESWIQGKLRTFMNEGFINNVSSGGYVYYRSVGTNGYTIKVARLIDDTMTLENVNIIDTYYDDPGDSFDYIIVNGSISFESADDNYTFIPAMADFFARFIVEDAQSRSIERSGVQIHINHSSLVLENGKIKGNGTYAFQIKKADIELPAQTYIDDYGESSINETTLNVQDDGTNPDIIFPPTHESSELYKVSMSFEALRGDTPRNLNSEEVWDMNISGSATLTSENVRLGNDLTRLAISTYGIKGETNTIYNAPTTYWLEPLEIGSGLSANTNPYQLLSKFQTHNHNDSISNTLQYSFVLDTSNDFIEKLWDYGRYGNWGAAINNISPNTIFLVKELYVSFGEITKKEIYAKLVDAIEVNNTEGDTMTISATFQKQGDID